MNNKETQKAYVLLEDYTNEQNGVFKATPIAVSTDWNKIHNLWEKRVSEFNVPENYAVEKDDGEGWFSTYEPGDYVINHYDLIIHTTDMI